MGVTTPERLLTLTASDLTVLGLDAVEQDTFRQELVVVLRARRRILQREAAQEAGGCDSEGRGNMAESQGRTHRAPFLMALYPTLSLQRLRVGTLLMLHFSRRWTTHRPRGPRLHRQGCTGEVELSTSLGSLSFNRSPVVLHVVAGVSTLGRYRAWLWTQDQARWIHGRLCPRLTCAMLLIPVRLLLPPPRVLLPINVMPLETRFKAFVRMTTPGLKPLFGRWVFYIRWCAWFFAMIAFCTMATYVLP